MLVKSPLGSPRKRIYRHVSVDYTQYVWQGIVRQSLSWDRESSPRPSCCKTSALQYMARDWRIRIIVHEGIIHAHDEDLAGVLELGMVNVGGNVSRRAGGTCMLFSAPISRISVSRMHTECCRNANDDAFALQLLRKVDFIAR